MSVPGLLISVTLPNFNHGRFLREAIESVLTQTYEHFEILCVDDGSTDDSREIIEEIASRDPRLKPAFFAQNRGSLQAVDNAWRRASGEIVFGFAADDALSDPDFFQLGIAALKAYPTAAGFYGLTQTISNGPCNPHGSMGSGLREGFIEPAEFVHGFLNGRIFVPGTSSLWRKRLVEEVGGYDEELGPQCDYYVNHILPALHGVIFCPRSFSRMRIWKQNENYSGKSSVEETLERLRLVERRLRSVAPIFNHNENDWRSWRKAHLFSLLSQKSPVYVFLIQIKAWLRAWMPDQLFFVTNIVGRYVYGRVMRVIALLCPRYRDLTKRFL